MHWTNILNELQKIKQYKFVHYENYRQFPPAMRNLGLNLFLFCFAKWKC